MRSSQGHEKCRFQQVHEARPGLGDYCDKHQTTKNKQEEQYVIVFCQRPEGKSKITWWTHRIGSAIKHKPLTNNHIRHERELGANLEGKHLEGIPNLISSDETTPFPSMKARLDVLGLRRQVKGIASLVNICRAGRRRNGHLGCDVSDVLHTMEG